MGGWQVFKSCIGSRSQLNKISSRTHKVLDVLIPPNRKGHHVSVFFIVSRHEF